MFEKELEEWADEMYPCDGQAQRYLIEGAEFGYNKAKEEMQENGLALQSDMDKTIEQNIALKRELNKAKVEAKDIINELLMNGYAESTREKAYNFLYPDDEK